MRAIDAALDRDRPSRPDGSNAVRVSAESTAFTLAARAYPCVARFRLRSRRTRPVAGSDGWSAYTIATRDDEIVGPSSAAVRSSVDSRRGRALVDAVNVVGMRCQMPCLQ